MIQKLKRFALAMVPIALFSFTLCLPQLLTGGVIIGSDAVFHYNRFYDAAMQIKNDNINYFISTYGFQQSGRIVNALYGPLFAYFQGVLVLLSQTWFSYQIVSRVIMGIIAGGSMYLLMRRAKVRCAYAILLSLFYLTTFSIQYWTLKQGFTSWGAAFFPLCLIPAVSFVHVRKVNILQLALAVAIMFQVHILSAVFLVLAYVPLFLYGFIKSKNKLKVIRDIFISIIIFVLLTLNIWIPLLEVSRANQLVQPFVNKNLDEYTITSWSEKLLYQPRVLIYIFLLTPLLLMWKWRDLKNNIAIIVVTCGFFIYLSSNLFPWTFLVKHKVQIVDIIQFPFRFFIPATILVLVAFGMILSQVNWSKKWLIPVLVLILGHSYYEVYQSQADNIQSQYFSDYPIQERPHTELLDDAETVRQSLHSTDLEEFLENVVKSTPDYLPQYEETKKNKYNLYEKLVIKKNDDFTKTTVGNDLIVTWEADDTSTISVPVIIYNDSQMVLNGLSLNAKDYDISAIGTPVVNQKVGQNKLVISYKVNEWFSYILIFTIDAWISICAIYLIQFVNWKPKHFRY